MVALFILKSLFQICSVYYLTRSKHRDNQQTIDKGSSSHQSSSLPAAVFPSSPTSAARRYVQGALQGEGVLLGCVLVGEGQGS